MNVGGVAHDVDAPRAEVLDLTDELLEHGRLSALLAAGESPELPADMSEDLVDQQVGQALE